MALGAQWTCRQSCLRSLAHPDDKNAGSVTEWRDVECEDVREHKAKVKEEVGYIILIICSTGCLLYS